MVTRKERSRVSLIAQSQKVNRSKELVLEAADVPVPKAKGPRHLFEVRLLLTLPAGSSVDAAHIAIIDWILCGSRGLAEVVVDYGAAIHNKTLQSPSDRSSYKDLYGLKMMCTGYDNVRLPKGAKKIRVLRKKEARDG